MKESLQRLARNAKERRSDIDKNSRNDHRVFKNETRSLQDRFDILNAFLTTKLLLIIF